MKIDVYAGSLTVEFEGEVVKFSIFDCIKQPKSEKSLCFHDDLEISDKEALEEFERDFGRISDIERGTVEHLVANGKGGSFVRTPGKQ